MPPVARLGDSCTGHGCFPPRPNVQGSGTVMVNNLPVHRQGDAWAVHCCAGCHDSALAAGWATVYVEGRQVGYVGAPVACGSAIAAGSPDVFVG